MNNQNEVKAIIVAAGRGQRMERLTADRPKCMLPFAGQPLIEWQLQALRAAGIQDITIVDGYLPSRISADGVNFVTNSDWANTNMVYSLMCASDVFLSGTRVMVAYSDIIYESRLVSALMESRHPVATVVDRKWLDIWSKRFDNPLDDAETLQLSDEGTITDIGNKPNSLSEIEGQFIGLTCFSAEGAAQFAETYQSIDQWEDGKVPRSCYFTDVLRALLKRNFCIDAVVTDSGWIEFDTESDMNLYQKLERDGELTRFWSVDGVAKT